MFTSTQKKGGILKPFKVASSFRFFSRTVAQRAKLHAALSRPSVDEYINDVVVWCKAHKKKRWVVKRVVPQTWLLRHVSFLSFFTLSFFLKNKSNEMTGSSYWTGAWDRSALSVCVGDHDDWEVKRKGLSPPRPTWLYFFVNKIIINKRPCAFSPSMQLSRKKWIGLLRGPLFFSFKNAQKEFSIQRSRCVETSFYYLVVHLQQTIRWPENLFFWTVGENVTSSTRKT